MKTHAPVRKQLATTITLEIDPFSRITFNERGAESHFFRRTAINQFCAVFTKVEVFYERAFQNAQAEYVSRSRSRMLISVSDRFVARD
jgi:hypothetical protein